MIQVTTQPIPQPSEIAQFAQGSSFQDCYAAINPWPDRTALEIFIRTVGSPPRWVRALMQLRNQIVRWLGLKNLGALQAIDPQKNAADYRVGDRVGIFTLLHLSEQEAVLGDADKHLEVRVSVRKIFSAQGQPMIAVSTVVHEHNWLGKVYMGFVGPVHKLIVPAVIRRGLSEV